MTTYTLHGWSQAETFIITLDHNLLLLVQTVTVGRSFQGTAMLSSDLQKGAHHHFTEGWTSA